VTCVRKTTLTIDDEKIAQAREILGTTGITDTIDAALRETIRRAAAERLIARMSTMDGLDLRDADVMDDAWR
jgi:Arc/MetJ family transcription regulator